MTPPKTKRKSESGRPERKSQPVPADRPSDENSAGRPPIFLEPDPPRSRPVLWWISGILMVAWMVFLLVIALSN